MIELREITAEDSERLFRWRLEPEVDRWMYSSPPSREAHRAWFAGYLADPNRSGWIILEGGAPAGSMMLEGVTKPQRRAKLSWYIGEADARGRGAGRAAQVLGLDLAFGRYGMRKVWSEVVVGNVTALKALAASGFRREGYLRRHQFKGGAEQDVVLLGILADEWAARRKVVRGGLEASGLIAREIL
jgi:RimJ/RimL family protein N-acetyltransferase